MTKQIQKQIQKPIDINKIADEIEKQKDLTFYWDYNDKLTDEQIIKIIIEEEGLDEVENEIYDNNMDYIFENVEESIKEYSEENNLNLTEEEQEELRYECESRFDFNFKGLLKNSSSNIRVTLENNYDIISFENYRQGDFLKNIKKDYVVKEFLRVFKKKYDKKELEEELNNVFDYGNFTFYFNISGENILNLREQVLKGFIELKKGCYFGLFDSGNGGGSLMDMKLKENIKLYLKDWRLKNKKDEILNKLNEKYSGIGYWEVNIQADEIIHYGIEEVYGLGSWGEY